MVGWHSISIIVGSIVSAILGSCPTDPARYYCILRYRIQLIAINTFSTVLIAVVHQPKGG